MIKALGVQKIILFVQKILLTIIDSCTFFEQFLLNYEVKFYMLNF